MSELDLAFDEQVGLFATLAWNQARAGTTRASESIYRAYQGDAHARRLVAAVPVLRYAAGPENLAVHPAHMFKDLASTAPVVEREWEPVTVVGGQSGVVTAPFP